MVFDFDKIIDRRGTYSLKYDFAAENNRGEDDLPLWVADMDISTPPEVIAALKERAEHGIFGYTMPKRDYFSVVSGWFESRHGWSPDPDKFICAPGVVFAINALIRAVTKVGDGVIICQPVYYPFADGVRRNGRRLVVSGLVRENGRYAMDFDDFEQKIASGGVKAFILCSPHNPVGRVWTEEELERIDFICAKHGVFVISDEIHADFTFGGHRHIPFACVAKKSGYAVCTSPSKSFNLAGLQISNIFIPDSAVRLSFEAELDKTGYWEPNTLGVTACLAAYGRGGVWLDELKVYLQQNMRYVQEYAAANIPETEISMPEGTYLMWMDCRRLGLDDKALSLFMQKGAHLWLDDGCIFGEGGSGFERLNAACPRATLVTAMERLEKAVNALKRGEIKL